MQTRITAHHFAASDGLRSHVSRSLEKLERYVGRTQDAHVILSDDRASLPEKRAEIALSAPRQTFKAAFAAPSHEAAVDGCVRQLRRQLARHRERSRTRKGGATARA